MKKYFNLLFLAVAMVGFVACTSEDETYEPGPWDATSDYADIYFPTASKTEMIDPSDPTETSFEVSRRNTEGALTVTFTEVQNTNNAFKVGQAVFADGEETTTVEVTFDEAGIGDAHVLQVTVDDPTLVSSYSAGILYTYTVTRVKWNEIGTATFTDEFWFEDSWEVEVLQRDDDPSYYRLMNPFGVWADELNGSQSEALELHVLKKGDKIGDIEMQEAGIVDWYRLCTGYVHPSYNDVVWALHPKNFVSADLNNYNVYQYNRVAEYLEDGAPGLIQLAPYWYMFNVGGWNYTTEPTIFINMPGYVAQYEADIDEDFEWESVFKGEYKSNQLGTANVAELQKGTCVTTTDDCDKIFADTYGTAYKIVAPYAEGYDLVFTAKGKTVKLAPGYEYPQPLGITALGKDVYAVINTDASSFTDEAVTLNITFVNANGTVEYGTANEVLSNITYSQVGTGDYLYCVMFGEGTEEDVDPGLPLFKRDGRDDIYKIENWGYGVDFFFTWDKTTNLCTVEEQYTGADHSSYGEIYVMESDEYGKYSDGQDGPSYFDPETNTFHFSVVYFVEAGYFGHGVEPFTVTFDAAAKAGSKKAPALGKYSLVSATKRTAKYGFKPAKNRAVTEGKFSAPKAADTLVKE